MLLRYIEFFERQLQNLSSILPCVQSGKGNNYLLVNKLPERIKTAKTQAVSRTEKLGIKEIRKGGLTYKLL